MSAEVQFDVALEGMLDAEIPCGGWRVSIGDAMNSCSNSAQLSSRMHGCAVRFKCVRCWQAWYVGSSAVLDRKGYLQCFLCHRRFGAVADFSDYGPF